MMSHSIIIDRQIHRLIVIPVLLLLLLSIDSCKDNKCKPNLIFVFADQWRAEAVGYAGNKQVITPAIDKFASEAVVFTNAISTFPVCTPYRASLMTGQYPLTNRVIYNDKPLATDDVCIAEVYKEAGYNTAYVGKWHINGGERDAFNLRWYNLDSVKTDDYIKLLAR